MHLTKPKAKPTNKQVNRNDQQKQHGRSQNSYVSHASVYAIPEFKPQTQLMSSQQNHPAVFTFVGEMC